MNDKRDNEIGACINRLEQETRLLRAMSLPGPVHILEMAILELRMALHAISEDELRAFADLAARQPMALAGDTEREALGNGHAIDDGSEPEILTNKDPQSRGRLGRAP